LIIIGVVLAAALLIVIPGLFKSPVSELTVSPVTNLPYRPLEEEKKFTSTDGEFGGTFSGSEPDEGNGSVASDGVTMDYKYLLNGRQMIARFEYTTSEPIGEIKDFQPLFDAFMQEENANGAVTERKDFAVKTDRGRTRGVQYRLEVQVSGSLYERYEKLILVSVDDHRYTIYELRYQNAARKGSEDEAARFFKSCFIKGIDLRERKP
jgi:hypothetical protein